MKHPQAPFIHEPARSPVWSLALLAVIPVMLFVTGILYLGNAGIYFLKGVDPEYAYLFNGLLLADLKPDIDYVYHPGTPMICVIAAVIRIVDLFRPGGLIPGVMGNPELYIRSTIWFVNTLGTLMLFYLGYQVYRRTHHLLTALVLQAVPFVHNLALEPLARMIPESLMLPVTCMWLVLLVRIMTGPGVPANGNKYALSMGLLTGFSIADKLTYLPFIVVPLFLLNGWKQKARFALFALLSFMIFAFPVLFKHVYFYHWITNILTHTGRYGSGDKGLLNQDEWINNLSLLAHNTPWLVFATALLAGILVIRGLLKKHSPGSSPLKTRLAISLVILVIFEFFLAAKQFAYHYMLPAILLTLPMILLALSLVHDMVPKAASWLRNAILASLLALVMIHIYPRVSSQLGYMAADRKNRAELFRKYTEMKPSGTLIASVSYYGCAAVEYALMFGLHESGKYSEYLYRSIRTLYPVTYLYLPWGKVYYEGQKVVEPRSIIDPGKEYALYVSEFSEERLEEITTSLKGDSTVSRLCLEPLYVDSLQHEALFRLRSY